MSPVISAGPDSSAKPAATPAKSGWRAYARANASAPKPMAPMGPPAVRDITTRPGSSARPAIKIKVARLPSRRLKSSGAATKAMPARAEYRRAMKLLLPNSIKARPVSETSPGCGPISTGAPRAMLNDCKAQLASPSDRGARPRLKRRTPTASSRMRATNNRSKVT